MGNYNKESEKLKIGNNEILEYEDSNIALPAHLGG
jgi:hypothetical protein